MWRLIANESEPAVHGQCNCLLIIACLELLCPALTLEPKVQDEGPEEPWLLGQKPPYLRRTRRPLASSQSSHRQLLFRGLNIN